MSSISQNTETPEARLAEELPQDIKQAAHWWYDFGFEVAPMDPATKHTRLRWGEWLPRLKGDGHEAIDQEFRDGDWLCAIVDDSLFIPDADTPAAAAALHQIEAAHDIAPNLVVKTKSGVHHYFRRAAGTYAKAQGYSSDREPGCIDIRTARSSSEGRSVIVLPPSPGKVIELNEADTAADLVEVDQEFIDAIFRHNGREAPRPPEPDKVATTRRTVNASEAAEIIGHIPPDIGYSDWLTVLMGVHERFNGSDEGLYLLDQWSASAGNYCGADELEYKYQGFAGAGGVTFASVCKLAQQHGADLSAIARRFDADGKTHPLALYRPPPDNRPREPGYILNGVLCDKTSFIGAYAGSGKTTAIAPLVLAAAGLIEIPGIDIYGWRRVVYISEHPEQLEMILAALIRHHGIDAALVWERIKIVEAVKMTAPAVAAVSPDYRALTVTHIADENAVDFPPWVIVDTQSALFQVENENDNAQMGEIVATIKQQMALPVSVIAHTAKVHKHGDAQTMSIRGGGALEGDANQVIYLSIDPETKQRYFEISAAKHRFVPRWDALELTYHVSEMPARDPFGRDITCQVGFCTVEPVKNVERFERKEQAEQERRREAVKDAREAVLALVVECHKLAKDNPTDPACYPSRRALDGSLDFPRAILRVAVDELLAEKRIATAQRPKEVAKSGPRDYLAPVELRRAPAAQSLKSAGSA